MKKLSWECWTSWWMIPKLVCPVNCHKWWIFSTCRVRRKRGRIVAVFPFVGVPGNCPGVRTLRGGIPLTRPSPRLRPHCRVRGRDVTVAIRQNKTKNPNQENADMHQQPGTITQKSLQWKRASCGSFSSKKSQSAWISFRRKSTTLLVGTDVYSRFNRDGSPWPGYTRSFKDSFTSTSTPSCMDAINPCLADITPPQEGRMCGETYLGCLSLQT